MTLRSPHISHPCIKKIIAFKTNPYSRRFPSCGQSGQSVLTGEYFRYVAAKSVR
jgi:hypothetical protein